MEMMIVWMAVMNHLVIVNQKVELVLEIYLLVIMEIAYLEFTSVMETMIVWIILMKMNVTNAMIESVMKKLSLLVLQIKYGIEHNVSPKNGCVMGIQIV